MRRRNHERGSVVVWTMIIVAILSLLGAEVLHVVSAKYQNAIQTASWQEALLGSESGIDLAIVELRKSLRPTPNYAWDTATGWNNTPVNGVTNHTKTTATAAAPMTISVNVDAPPALVDANNGWQYYRIRAVGTVPMNAPPRANDNKQDTRLRRLSLHWERFTNGALLAQAISTPQASRRTEAIVRPVSSFDQAIMSVGMLDLTDQNIIIDSYDSRSPTKSTGGLYDVTKRQENGDIATDGQILNAGNAHVYGDVSTNSGTVSGVANVTGQQRDDFYQEPIAIAAPNWSSVNASPILVNGTTTLAASATAGSAASRYVLSSVSLSGTQVLTLSGAANGSLTYIEIYVTGDVQATGNAQVILAPGVRAKLYFAGNVSIAGNGVVNSNNQPGDLILYGINPPDGSARSLQLGGNSQLSAAVYAPAFDVQINNGGTRGSVYGSFVGKTMKMNGVTDLHYDEALGSGGVINSYKIVSWFEDTR